MKKINIALFTILALIILFSAIKIYKLKFQSVKPVEKIHYSQKTALNNIENNYIILVIDDKEKDKLNKKYNYTEQFGFKYKYEPYEENLLLYEDVFSFDDDVEIPSNKYNISDYNEEIEAYLTSKDSLWYTKIEVIEDSLKFLKIDRYGLKHPINIASLKIPKEENLPQTMIDAIKELKNEASRLSGMHKDDVLSSLELREYKMDSILNKIDNNKDYNEIRIARYWGAYHYEDVLIELIDRIANNTEVGLINTADLIIPERNENGDLQFYGHGGVVFDDLFKVGGRANHLLKRLTGEDFGNVSMYDNEKELKRLQHRWFYWYKNLNN
jgi:hypothetical protein